MYSPKSKQVSATEPFPGPVIKHLTEIEKCIARVDYQSAQEYPAATGDVTRNLQFSEKSIRNAFIRKVYSILMMQMLISAVFIALFIYNNHMKNFVKENPSLLLIAFVVMFITLISMSCCETARRVAPTNYICLFVFTIAQSFLLGVISAANKSEEVLLAVGICAIVCFSLIIFAMQTKYDFTTCGAGLFVALILMVLFSMVLIFFPSNTGRLVYAVIGCLLFSLYLIYDTQLLIGSNHKYAISPEEYVFAALNLYIDVVQLFLMILRIVGSRN